MYQHQRNESKQTENKLSEIVINRINKINSIEINDLKLKLKYEINELNKYKQKINERKES